MKIKNMKYSLEELQRERKSRGTGFVILFIIGFVASFATIPSLIFNVKAGLFVDIFAGIFLLLSLFDFIKMIYFDIAIRITLLKEDLVKELKK